MVPTVPPFWKSCVKTRACCRRPSLASRSIALVGNAFSAADLGLEKMRVVETEPSLEDVFVTLSRARHGHFGVTVG